MSMHSKWQGCRQHTKLRQVSYTGEMKGLTE